MSCFPPGDGASGEYWQFAKRFLAGLRGRHVAAADLGHSGSGRMASAAGYKTAASGKARPGASARSGGRAAVTPSSDVGAGLPG